MKNITKQTQTTEPAPRPAAKYGVIWAQYYAPNEPTNYIQCVDVSELKENAEHIRYLDATGIFQNKTPRPFKISTLLERLAAARYDYIFVYDDLFFTFLDAYCLGAGYANYDDIKDDSGKRRRIPPRTYCERSGSGAAYTRKIWIAAAKEGSTDRHKRTHAITFVNFSPVVGMPRFYDCVDAFGLRGYCEHHLRVYTLREIVKTFDEYYTHAVGAPYLGKKPAGWTAGALARSHYLRLKYPELKTTSDRLYRYQQEHPADEVAELHYRDGALLLGGIMYMQRGINAATLTELIRKYDCNGLYSYKGGKAPEFIHYQKISPEDYFELRALSSWSMKGYIAILKFTRLSMSVKDDMPPLFANPFDEDEREDITINRPYYMFNELYEELQHYYDIYEAEIESVILCTTQEDPAILEYVTTFDQIKREGKDTGNDALAYIGKFFNNNLMGKFSQHTAQTPSRLAVVDGVVERQYADDVQSVWKSQHFDYVRGAYIYISARVYVMQIWRTLKLFHGWKASNLLYIDTDCFITRDVMPENYLHSYMLGAFKVENEYNLLRFITYKRYVGIDVKTGLSVKCAGIQNAAIKGAIQFNHFEGDAPYEWLFDSISDWDIKTPILRRTECGGYYSYEPQAIRAVEAFTEEYKSI